MNTNSITSYIITIFIAIFSISTAYAGGLDEGTTVLTNLKVWGYTFIGVGATCYVIYTIAMALMERKQWSDVAMAIVYCAIAGGSVLAAEYARSVWG